MPDQVGLQFTAKCLNRADSVNGRSRCVLRSPTPQDWPSSHVAGVFRTDIESENAVLNITRIISVHRARYLMLLRLSSFRTTSPVTRQRRLSHQCYAATSSRSTRDIRVPEVKVIVGTQKAPGAKFLERYAVLCFLPERFGAVAHFNA